MGKLKEKFENKDYYINYYSTLKRDEIPYECGLDTGMYVSDVYLEEYELSMEIQGSYTKQEIELFIGNYEDEIHNLLIEEVEPYIKLDELNYNIKENSVVFYFDLKFDKNEHKEYT